MDISAQLLLAERIGLKPTILYIELLDYADRISKQGIFPVDGWMELSDRDLRTIGLRTKAQDYCINKLINRNLLFKKVESNRRFLQLNPDPKVLESVLYEPMYQKATDRKSSKEEIKA
jgi:hypothetical protein